MEAALNRTVNGPTTYKERRGEILLSLSPYPCDMSFVRVKRRVRSWETRIPYVTIGYYKYVYPLHEENARTVGKKRRKLVVVCRGQRTAPPYIRAIIPIIVIQRW